MGDLLAQFGIDWRLLLAQAVNFGIVAGLLAWFVFRPLLSFLEERRKRIQEGLEMRQKAEDEIARTQEMRKQELARVKRQAEQLLSEAKERGAEREREMIARAKEETGKELARAQEDIRREKDQAIQEAKEEIATLALLSAEKVLKRAMTAKDREALLQEIEESLQSHAR
ncbi:MAG: F0F1 ATP synthase subunit B [Candidatus Yanofskybacteria bacterium]|nr:F0F1 ATP synthase subunit B [Candidatus Yanofskybacteria bacterium]